MTKHTNEIADAIASLMTPDGRALLQEIQDRAAAQKAARSALKFNEHPDSRQATKKDLVDIANALGRTNVTERLFSVPEIRASIRMRLAHLSEAGQLDDGSTEGAANHGAMVGRATCDRGLVYGAEPTPRMPSVRVTLTEGDLANLLHALEILGSDLAAQAVDPTQQNAHGLLELKLGEVQGLRAKLVEALDPNGDGPKSI
jgi:hypothetical protein